MEKKEKPAVQATATPATTPNRKILDEKPVRAVEPRQPRVINQSSNIGASRPTFDLSTHGDRDIGAAVKQMENRWQAAIPNHDVSRLNALLAPDFIGTSATGRVGSKATLLSELRRDKNSYTSVEASGMSVRTSGADTAIVTGVTREAGTTPDGKRFRNARRFTDTWVKRKGKWRCIASQTTAL